MSDWQPIETAPKGSAIPYPPPLRGFKVTAHYILGFIPDELVVDPNTAISVVWWEPLGMNGKDGCWVKDGSEYEVKPTHWMPLPAPPEAK